MKQIEDLIRDDMKLQRSGHVLELVRLFLLRGDKKDLAEALRLTGRETIQRPGIEPQLLYSWALEMNEQVLLARKSIRTLLAKNIYTAEVLERASIIEEKLRNKNLADVYKTQLNLSKQL